VTDDKRPVEQAVEAILYAPLGFALEARRLLPTFVERGRAQVQMAKVMGEFAVQQGTVVASKQLGKQLGKAQDLAADLLSEYGLTTSPSSAPQETTGREATGSDTGGPGPAGSRNARKAPTQSGPDAAVLAIAGYDSLAASQVIPRLEGLEADELEAVRRYEAAHRGRKTILGKISQLQGE